MFCSVTPLKKSDVCYLLKPDIKKMLASVNSYYMKSLFAKYVKSTPTCSSFTFQRYVVNGQ